MATTNVLTQLFHNAARPLDASEQVDYFTDLSDVNKVVPYQGKLVHVKADGILYVWLETGNAVSWRPVLADNGSALYLSTEAGETFKGYVERDGVNTGRIIVDYPATINHPTA